MGRGGISLPVSVSFPVSRLGLVPAVNPKEVTFPGEIKDHGIQGGESAGKPALVFISRAGMEGLSLAKILQLLLTELSM